MSTRDARKQLRDAGLRVTQPRLELMRLFEQMGEPISHSDAVRLLGERGGDPATAYRNLVRLVEVGLARIASTVGGVTYFEGAHPTPHTHPHFHCQSCGTVSCLPEDTQVEPPTGRWGDAVSEATLTFVGRCPDCRSGQLKRP